MAFDYEAARKEGYSDAQIADYLAKQSKFDVVGARNEGYTDQDILQHLSSKAGFTYAIPKAAEPEKESGVIASAIAGTKQLLGSQLTGLKTLIGDEDTAAVEGIKRQEAISKKYAPAASLEKVKQAYAEQGVLGAAGEVFSQAPGAIAQQIPQLAEMWAGAQAGALVAGPWGAAIGAAAPLFVQFVGSNAERQAQEQIQAGKPVDVSTGAAVAGAIPQAALDLVETRLLFGAKFLSNALGIGEKSLSKMSTDAVEKIAQEKLLPLVLKGTAKGAALEVPTELAQQVIERAQAGLPLTTPDAVAEYGDTAYNVALLGPLGAAGRAGARSAARSELETRRAEEAAATPEEVPQVEIVGQPGVQAPTTEAPAPIPPAPITPEVQALVDEYGFTPEEAQQVVTEAAATPETVEPEAIQNAGELAEPVAGTVEPSVSVPIEQGRAEPGVEKAPSEGLGMDTTGVQGADVRQGEEQRALEAEPVAEPVTSKPTPEAAPIVEAPETKPGLQGIEEPVQAMITSNLGEPFVMERKFQGKYDILNPNGEKVGAISYAPRPDGTWRVSGVEVAPEYQRQGIATAAYDAVEQIVGQPVVPSGSQSEAGAAFWESRKEAEPVTSKPMPEAAPIETPVVEAPVVTKGKRGRPAKTAEEKAVTAERAAQRKLERKESGRTKLLNDARYKLNKAESYLKTPDVNPDVFPKTAEGRAALEAARNELGAKQVEGAKDIYRIAHEPALKGTPNQKKAMGMWEKFSPQEKKAVKAMVDAETPSRAEIGAATESGLVESTDGRENGAYLTLNNPSQALAYIRKTGNEFEKALAQRIAPFLQGTKLVIVHDMTDVPKNVRAKFKGAVGMYDNVTRTIYLSAEGGLNNTVFLHEAVHGATIARINQFIKARNAGTPIPKNIALAMQELESLMQRSKNFYSILKASPDTLTADQKRIVDNMDEFLRVEAFDDVKEFIAYGFTHPAFQQFLYILPGRIKGEAITKANGFTKFVDSVRRILGMDDKHDSALQDLIAITDTLIGAPAFKGPDVSMVEETLPSKLTPNAAGEEARKQFEAFGGTPTEQKQNVLNRIKNSFTEKATALREAQEKNNSWTSSLFGKGMNIASFDREFSRRMWNHIQAQEKKGDLTFEEAKLAAIKLSMSQALHRATLANQMIDEGNWTYNPDTNRWTVVADDVNMRKMEGVIKSLAARLNIDPDEARRIMGAAYEANRLNGFMERAAATEKQLAATEAALEALRKKKGKTAAELKEVATKKAIIKLLEKRLEDLSNRGMHKDEAQVAAGMALYNANPEIAEGTRIWNTMRERVIAMLVQTGVYTPEKAEAYLAEAAYVPFFRDMKEETEAGPKVLSGGIRESMRDYKQKGSMREVKDVIGNMYQWMQWSMARAISNQQLQVMLDNYEKAYPDEVKEGGKGDNTFIVHRDGIPRRYEVADPAVAQAFMGMENVYFPAAILATKASNVLRHIITRMPLFAPAQLLMDSYTAMYTSGVKNPGALLLEIAKEVKRTASGTSTTRKALQNVGVLETREYAALSGEEALNMHLSLNKPSSWHRLMNTMDRLAAGADNVVRQGVYNQLIKEGASQEEATEVATEIVNFRRASGNQTVRFLGRVVPFFNAYLQVLDVSLRTVIGTGVSPKERSAAIKTFLATSTKVAALSALYAAMVSDDEDYEDKNRVVRDRMFMIPGTGGLGIPLRADIFALPKIIGEYSYNILSDKGTTDSRMFKEAMSRAVINTISPPSEAVPQLVKPVIEVATNHNFFQGRPIVSPGMERIEKEFQFDKNTSEFAKALGAASGASPLVIDHVMKGYFGSVMSLFAITTNDAIRIARGLPPPPEKSTIEQIMAFPGASAFLSRPENTAAAADFYEVYKDISTAANTLNRLKKTAPEQARGYAAEKADLLKFKASADNIQRQLVKLAKTEEAIRTSDRFTAEEKQAKIGQLREAKDRMHANILKLRQQMYGE